MMFLFPPSFFFYIRGKKKKIGSMEKEKKRIREIKFKKSFPISRPQLRIEKGSKSKEYKDDGNCIIRLVSLGVDLLLFVRRLAGYKGIFLA